jgi:hypothetical protein
VGHARDFLGAWGVLWLSVATAEAAAAAPVAPCATEDISDEEALMIERGVVKTDITQSTFTYKRNMVNITDPIGYGTLNIAKGINTLNQVKRALKPQFIEGGLRAALIAPTERRLASSSVSILLISHPW